jgi:hypothetical protein
MAEYFSDNQIKRFLIQFARIFSNWNVSAGTDSNGNPILHRVPIMYGDSSRQAATIIANNSSNNLPSSPLLTYYISGLEYDQRRTQDPYFIDKVHVRQRTFNEDSNEWETTQGNAFTVERVMPVPYTLRITLDFWSTNYNQKLEIIEQLGVLFNPSMELQSTDNFIDWTSLSVVYQDGINFTSRSIPMGTGNPVDVLSWKFYMPIWISGPIKVKKLNVIHKIIASIFTRNYRDDIKEDDLLLGTRQKITPYGYKVLLLEDKLQIVGSNQPFNPSNSSIESVVSPHSCLSWRAVLNAYGVIRPGISMIALENPYLETEILGTISYLDDDDNVLVYNIDLDTLPQNTLEPVNSVIDPTKKSPDNGLSSPETGQRYLIVEDIPSQIQYTTPTVVIPAWPGLTNGAAANDIIEFDGVNWFISFDSTVAQDTQFVTNITSGVQYRFFENSWVKSWEGWYGQGDWRIII